jgi:hypothetical protein
MGHEERTGLNDPKEQARREQLAILHEELDALRDARKVAFRMCEARPSAENVAAVRRYNRETRRVLDEIAELAIAPGMSNPAAQMSN